MDFKETLKTVVHRLNDEEVDFALIGAFALMQCGIERTTRDIDFLIDADDKEKAEKVMADLDYEAIQIGKMFSQYESPVDVFGNIDFLHVSSKEGKQILKDANTTEFSGSELRIVRIEDLIGLKVLAYANDPGREGRDKSDIQLIYEVYEKGKIELDLDRIKSYYVMFNKMEDYKKLWSNN